MARAKEQDGTQRKYKRDPLHFMLLHFSSVRNRAPLPTTRASESIAGRVQFSASGPVNPVNPS